LITGGFGDLQEFIRQANTLVTLGELRNLMDSLIRELGFQYFALTHHVAMVNTPAGVVRLHNYPDTWVEAIIQRKYFAIDPVHIVAQRSATGFHWSEFQKFMKLTDDQQDMQSEAKRAGIHQGFTIPVNVPGEYTGSVSYAIKDGIKFPHASLPYASFLGPIAFEAARRIVGGQSRFAIEEGVQLTPRQLDCLSLVALGKSDVDIGQILSLSPATVRFHVDAARERLNTSSRHQAVIRALFGSHLTFADLLNRPDFRTSAPEMPGTHPLQVAR
jgi:LuxR family quorum-sensing system transcriptional regulator CciR